MSNNSKGLVLVTGASGYIACHIIKLLLDSGYTVRGTVRNLNDSKKVDPLKQLTPYAKENLELVEADLLKPDTWQKAVEGCQYVLHTASPFPPAAPKNADELIKPAVDGTLQVLRACADCSQVKRVVLTSSVASVMGNGSKTTPYTEIDWTDVNELDLSVAAYNASKTLAEKAACDFVNEQKPSFELVVVNPGFVMGPLLHNCECTSAEIVKRLLNLETPLIAKISLPIIDVRDVAKAHVKAMTLADASNNRYLLVNQTLWVKDVADVLRKEFRPQGYWVPSVHAPYALLWVSSFFDKGLQLILRLHEKFCTFDNARMRQELGVEPIDCKDTILDMAYSLIDRGFVRRTSRYKPKRDSSSPSSNNNTKV